MPDFLKHQQWWVQRVAALPAHLLFFVIVTFFLVRMIPGDPILVLLGQNYSPEGYRALQEQLGLDGSVPAQLWRYLGGIVHLDLGDSLISGRPVLTELLDRLPPTLELALLGLGASILVSLAAAYFLVSHPTNPLSRILRGYARAAGAIPEYVLAIAAIFVFYATLHLAPAPLGRLSVELTSPAVRTGFPLLDAAIDCDWPAFASTAAHLVLPVCVLVLSQSALLMKLLVSALDEAAAASPTLFRIASGAGRGTVLLSVFRRAAPASVTMAGILFGYLLGGAVVLENLFGFTGLGSYVVDAVASGDFVATQGFLLVVATLSLFVFLVVDLVTMLLDPRRRAGAPVQEP